MMIAKICDMKKGNTKECQCQDVIFLKTSFLKIKAISRKI